MDKKIANNLAVGAFVLIGLVAFVFVLFTIGGGRSFLSREAVFKAKFTHVKGLNFGSEVSLMGLRVGTVKKISVPDYETKDLIVEFSIDNAMTDKIRQDSVASIRTSGVLGDKYIEVSIGTPKYPALKSGDFITAEEPKDFLAKTNEIVTDVGQHFAKNSDFAQLLHHMNRVSANLERITSQLQNEKGLYAELVGGTSGAKVSKATGHLENILRKVNNGEGTLGALINDPTVYEDLKTMMGGAKRSAILRYFMKSFMDAGASTQEAPKKK